MSPEMVMTIANQALELVLLMTGVILLPALAVGLLVSMFQAATQLNEQTLSFIPKLGVTFITLMVAGSWLLQLLMTFTKRLITDIPMIIG
ncbi:MAG: flagellar biosynthesis protein FliQ [Gammaproteobacteria bacterium]|nr:flagellar biosynthesis protein FliQ [Gammaproteobacteria bacterium]MCF6261507.1 flagellar biosynthesis protein FliQ [Gammaproteobacteria bacterium]